MLERAIEVSVFWGGALLATHVVTSGQSFVLGDTDDADLPLDTAQLGRRRLVLINARGEVTCNELGAVPLAMPVGRKLTLHFGAVMVRLRRCAEAQRLPRALGAATTMLGCALVMLAMVPLALASTPPSIPDEPSAEHQAFIRAHLEPAPTPSRPAMPRVTTAVPPQQEPEMPGNSLLMMFALMDAPCCFSGDTWVSAEDSPTGLPIHSCAPIRFLPSTNSRPLPDWPGAGPPKLLLENVELSHSEAAPSAQLPRGQQKRPPKERIIKMFPQNISVVRHSPKSRLSRAIDGRLADASLKAVGDCYAEARRRPGGPVGKMDVDITLWRGDTAFEVEAQTSWVGAAKRPCVRTRGVPHTEILGATAAHPPNAERLVTLSLQLLFQR